MGAGAVPIGIAAFSGANSAYGAYSQNRATKKSMNSARDAATVQIAQIDEATALERQKRKAEAASSRARLAVLNADSGFANDGSFAALDQQTFVDEQLNLETLDRNAYFQKKRVVSGLDADLTTLMGRYINPLIATIGGAASGYSTGIQIQGAIDQYNQRSAAGSGGNPSLAIEGGYGGAPAGTAYA